MDKGNQYLAIGLMSGTSLDGIDAALIRTDGMEQVEPVGYITLPYDPDLRAELRSYLGAKGDTYGNIAKAEKELTLAHCDAVRELLAELQIEFSDIDIIGFHGHTITHDPDTRFTWQIGDGRLMADELGEDVVYDFRSSDVMAGGQGAPLVPLYHWAMALSTGVKLPAAVLNIGGVANITWISDNLEKNLVAFDTGPGNALIDDFVSKRLNMSCDFEGKIAASGSINQDILMRWLSDPYFAKNPPKSLDRNRFNVSEAASLSNSEAVATLTAFTIFSVHRAFEKLSGKPVEILVSGGGRRNLSLMAGLQKTLGIPVRPVEEVGWNGDSLEAEGFAYLAVRHILGLPITYPNITGVLSPMSGGVLCKAKKS
jgi:anhydro-N-acetylmuramic acid kinase